MAWLVLVLDVVFLSVAFGYRTWRQWRRTGDAGWRLGRPRSRAEVAARTSMVGSGALLAVGLAGAVVDGPGMGAAGSIGVGVALASILLVVIAQLQMGDSWRIGVDPAERTGLVTSGVYRRVRNPIYTGMVVFAIGQALMLPSVWSVAAVLAMGVGVEIQVRAIEEPYLRQLHGDAFDAWVTSSGRFVPSRSARRSLTARPRGAGT
jgi:protein-S-isoprenylcysteine O-methyltransferase Ste14